MAKFLTTRGTTSEIERIINNAQTRLVLLSPFVKIPESLFQNIVAADQRGVRVTLVYGKNKDKLDRNTQSLLGRLNNLRILFLENLHAKCYFNEQDMVITSLNLYDFSEQNNREMGLLVSKANDEEAFNEALKEARMIILLASQSTQRDTRQGQSTYSANRKRDSSEVKGRSKSILFKDVGEIFRDALGLNKAHCIGCGTRIQYDEYRPFCLDCYKLWKNDRKAARYCHACGREAPTTLNKPLCRSCWEDSL